MGDKVTCSVVFDLFGILSCTDIECGGRKSLDKGELIRHLLSHLLASTIFEHFKSLEVIDIELYRISFEWHLNATISLKLSIDAMMTSASLDHFLLAVHK